MKKEKILIIRILITLVCAFLIFYVTLPAINLSNPSFYGYLFTIFMIYLITGTFKMFDLPKLITNYKRLSKKTFIIFSSIALIFVLIILINVFSSPLFNAKSYANRILVDETKEFIEDIKEVDFNALPLLDKESSTKLGDRVMGQMKELVSQFYVSDLYTQINFNNDIVRVTPLEYDGLIKYLGNRSGGVKGYIKVNSVSGETELVKLEKGMKYMPSAYFFENLNRYLRFKYPTEIFGDTSFEIDNEGNPYWIVSTVKYSAIGLRKDIKGAIILNPITGESKNYKVEEIPTWVDQVYDADLIIEQVNDWGKYQKGFFNSIFGQKGVVQTTEGYNYTVMNDDVFLYTGITSISSDESNIGFILTNLRTKETKFYNVPGAEEYSAMASAEGQVQQMDYKASFPLLINLNNRPTYLISLKDNAGLVKMYAFVDVSDYQKVVVTDASKSIEEAANNYLNNAEINLNENNVITKEIVISQITSANIDGNTFYYIIDTNNQKYKVSIKVDINRLPFFKNGDTINISYVNQQEIIEIKSINKIS